MSVAHEERAIAITVPKDKSEVITSFLPSDFEAPTGREEEWRFTPLRRMKPLLSQLAITDGATVEIDGDPSVIGVDAAAGPIQPGEWLVPVDVVSAFAWAGAPEMTLITIPAKTDLEKPVTVTITGTSTSYQNVRVTIEHDSSATVVINHQGTGQHAENIEVEVGARSQLKLVVIQDWDRDAVHLGRIHSHVGRDATLTQVVATFGGDLVRLVSTVDYDGPGGSAELLGAFFADAGQHLEHRLFVDHNAPHCRSNVVYKGALQGEHAHTVWIGDVLIRAQAVGTDTYEINRNLVLSDGARADSVPNLEIETGEVSGAGHASATGRFDDEQLFYLMARGIAADDARRMVVRGFFTEVLDQIPNVDIRDRLWAAVDDEIGAVGSGVES
jgi:Fe-S cluster assembly protein SufD